MVGGDSDAFDAALPLLKLLGKNITHQGGAGAGQHAKMCNQIVIAGTMIGVCESLLYAQAAELNAKAMLAAISGGAVWAPLAILALVLWPLVWLLALPFRLVGITFTALFAFLAALLMLPARLLGGGPRPAAASS